MWKCICRINSQECYAFVIFSKYWQTAPRDAGTFMFSPWKSENAGYSLQTLFLAYWYISVWAPQTSVWVLKKYLYFLLWSLFIFFAHFFCWPFTHQFLDTLYILGKLTLRLWRELQIPFPFCLQCLVGSGYGLPCRSFPRVVDLSVFPLWRLDF